MLEKLHIIVALFAALAVTILSMFQDVTFDVMCMRLLVVIPVFFVFGLIYRRYMRKIFAPPAPPPSESEENPDDTGEEPQNDVTVPETIDDDDFS